MEPKLPYQLLVFDWEGTLVDSQAAVIRCVKEAASEAGLSVPQDQEIRHTLGLSIEQGIKQLFPEVSSTAYPVMLNAYKKLCLLQVKAETAAFSSAPTILQQLIDHGYWLAVATGKSRRGLDADLLNTGLLSLFSTTRTVDESPCKPNPQMLMDILDELGLTEADALMIGDSEFDLLMAEQAAVDAVAICTGTRDKNYLNSYHCLTCLEDLAELPVWLSSQKNHKG